jgi:xylan 1,4-beta-xylosidase
MARWREFVWLMLAAASLVAAASPDVIAIDTAAPARPFPHFWERAFGSGRANLSLRDSYRADLRTVRQSLGFEYVRFHAIFHDENGVYQEDASGQPVYNWSYVDHIYDGLLASHVRPLVELSFMPAALSSSPKPHAFWYKPLANPPRDYDKWGALVEAFTRHLVDRYGLDEVSRWIFEVWNEPNIDFWTGEPKEETYYQLYDSAAIAVKKVSPSLRIGGPATAQAAWVGRFIDHCVKNGVPLDFVSTHVYGNDRAEDVFGTHENIPRSDMVARAVKKVHDEIAASARPKMPLYWTEFNASYMNEVNVTDSPYIGPWLANTIRMCDGLVDMMSYWTFSDVFEEQGVVKTPFYGGYGLIAAGNIPKAALNDFRLLHKLGTSRILNASDSVLVTRRSDGSLAIAVWNYSPPEEPGASRKLQVELKGLTGPRALRITTVDAQHGSPLALWESMGKPAFPTRAQQQKLRFAGQMPPAQQRHWTPDLPLEVTLAPKALTLIEVPSARGNE